MSKNTDSKFDSLIDVAKHFDISDIPTSYEQNCSGHINSTYIMKVGEKGRYVLQKINTSIFENPDELMSNIIGITDFIRKKFEKAGIDSSRRTLNFHKCDNGKYYFKSKNGECWRLYDFIDNVTSYMSVDNPVLFYNCAKAFGEFQQLLSDYPADTLYETIPNFHNTVSRLNALKKAIDEDPVGRKCEVLPEIDFVMSHSHYCSYITDRINDKTYSIRVTHNDTKLNNILMDNETMQGICVIDLDTVMPGSVLYDFGDSIRYGACSTAEDETDQSKVFIRLDLFEEFTKGFLNGIGNSLSKKEISGLPYGVIVITLEIGIRFLTDYLNGDIYFATHRKGQNLDRARTQFAMVADMEKHLTEMNKIVEKYGL